MFMCVYVYMPLSKRLLSGSKCLPGTVLSSIIPMAAPTNMAVPRNTVRTWSNSSLPTMTTTQSTL